MAKHASLGASSARRWMSCSGSPQMIKKAGIYEPPSIHAKKGTAVHSVIEDVLGGVLPEPEDAVGKKYEGIEIDVDMAAGARVMVDYVRERIELAPGAKLLLEQRVDLGSYAPPGEPMFGRTDTAVVDVQAGILEVIDFKNGVGVLVEVDNNPQLRFYCLGTWLSLSPEEQSAIHTVKTTVVQPNAPHHAGPVRSSVISVLDLLTWAEELREAALATTRPNATLVAGEWCRWCSARSVCPERNSQKELDAFSDFVPDLTPGPLSPTVVEQVSLLSPAQVADFLAKAKALKALIADAEAFLAREIMEGRPVAGYKLVEGPGRRAFVSKISDAVLAAALNVAEDQVDETLELMGVNKYSITIPDVLRMLDIDEKLFWEERKHVSPSQLEKRVGKKHPSYKALALLSERKKGKPTLAPESDSRPEYGVDPDDFQYFDDLDTLEGEFTVEA